MSDPRCIVQYSVLPFTKEPICGPNSTNLPSICEEKSVDSLQVDNESAINSSKEKYNKYSSNNSSGNNEILVGVEEPSKSNCCKYLGCALLGILTIAGFTTGVGAIVIVGSLLAYFVGAAFLALGILGAGGLALCFKKLNKSLLELKKEDTLKKHENRRLRNKIEENKLSMKKESMRSNDRYRRKKGNYLIANRSNQFLIEELILSNSDKNFKNEETCTQFSCDFIEDNKSKDGTGSHLEKMNLLTQETLNCDGRFVNKRTEYLKHLSSEFNGSSLLEEEES